MVKKFKTIRVSEADHARLLKIKEEEYTPICKLIEVWIDRHIAEQNTEDT